MEKHVYISPPYVTPPPTRDDVIPLLLHYIIGMLCCRRPSFFLPSFELNALNKFGPKIQPLFSLCVDLPTSVTLTEV